MNRRVKRVVYVAAVMVLLALGMTLWYMQAEVVEQEEFTVEGQREAVFTVRSGIAVPRLVRVRLDGRLDCNARLLLRSLDERVKSRSTFPLQAGELKGKELECKWHSSDFTLELRTDSCTMEHVKIVLKIIE